MKVIIQMPCLNEEDSLPVSLGDLPRELEGVDEVEWLIINDGSRDNTVEVAKELGVDYIISHVRNLGLAQAFLSGMNAAVALVPTSSSTRMLIINIMPTISKNWSIPSSMAKLSTWSVPVP